MSDTIYVKHESGALHEYSGKKASRLRRECLAGRGMKEIVELRLAGYEGFMGRAGGEIIEDLDALPDYYAKLMGR